MSAFAGLTDGDFAAYAPPKWRSNVHNRERMEVRQKLLALGRAIAPRLVLAGEDAPLVVDASPEHPTLANHKTVDAQHLYFARADPARPELDRHIDRGRSLASHLDAPTPQHNHVFLALSVDHERAAVALRLHAGARIDRENLERKWEDHFERAKLVAILRALGPSFIVGAAGDDAIAADQIDEHAIGRALSSLAEPRTSPALSFAPPSPRLFHATRTWPRAELVAAGASFEQVALASLSALLPAYRFLAWSRDNDFISMREALERERQTKRQRGLAPRDEVRVVRGVLAGKIGVVQDVDARGGLRLLVGTVAVKVDAADVAIAEGAGYLFKNRK